MNNMKVAVVDNPESILYSLPLVNNLRVIDSKNVNVVFYLPKNGKMKFSNAKRVWTSTLYPFQILNEIKKDRPDILHLQYDIGNFGPVFNLLFFPFLIFVLTSLKVKTVVTLHTVFPLDGRLSIIKDALPFKIVKLIPMTPLKILLVFFHKAIVAMSDAIILHGYWLEKDLIDFYGVDESKVHVIPHGAYDTENLDSMIYRYWKNRFDGKKIILSFGKISPRKGLDRLIRAFSLIENKNPDCVLVMAGREASQFRHYIKELKQTIVNLNLSKRIIYLGFIDYKHVHALYKIADFVVLFYRYSASASGPLAFAMQYGKPVIATNIGVFREELGRFNGGVLIPVDDIASLAEALHLLAVDKKVSNSLSQNMKKLATSRSWATTAKRTYRVYERVSNLCNN